MADENNHPNLNFQLKRRHWLGMAGILVFTTVVGLFYWARFETYSVCYHCALKREAVVWEVPFIHKKIFETAEVYSTTLSDVILAHELMDEHEHDWKFVFGSGNGSPLVFGTSRGVASVMTSSKAGEFLDLVMQYSGRTEARRWLAGYRDFDRAEWCRCIAEAAHGLSFAHTDDFESWLAKTMADNEGFWR